MIILGIDPGTGRTGYGVVKHTQNTFKMLDYGCIETKANSYFPKRLDTIHKRIKEIIKLHKPDAIACEELFFFKNAKTALKVAHARGVIILACKGSKAELFEYTPLQVKLRLVGKGRADKKEVQAEIKKLLKMENALKSDDAADALAIAVCHGMACRSNTKRNI